MAQDWLEKIRALLTRAEHEATPEEERSSCLAMASRLMEKHAIDEHQLNLSDPTKATKVISRTYFKDEKGTAYVKAKRELLFSLTAINGLKAISFGPNGRLYTEVFGYPSDLDFLDMIYASILIQMNTELARSPNISSRSSKTSYAHGYVDTVARRLWTAKHQANGANIPGQAIVLRDRSQLVADALSAAYPKTRKASLTKASTNDFSAYNRGKADGLRADLNSSSKLTHSDPHHILQP